ncbi:MAG: UTRA domain-containing protein [Chloroflexota bacterium]|jgi:GntR family transcriptional regulator
MADQARSPGRLRQIDRTAPTPLYHQLEQIIRAEIDAGLYRPGDLLPSENEICATYHVSRSVTRQTLRNLAHAGFIRTVRGRGSFVAEKKLSERFVQRASGFYDDVTRMGLEVGTRVLRQEITEVPLEVGEFLGVTHAIRIDRVRSVAGRVLAYVVTYLPRERCPGLETFDLTDRSLYAHLRSAYGLRVHSGERTVEAVPAEGEVAHHLEVAQGTPLLLLRSAGRTHDGAPLEWFEAWHRADRTRFAVEMVPGEPTLPFQPTVVPLLGGDRAPIRVDRRGSGPGVDVWSTPFGARLRTDRIVAVVRAPRYADGRVIAGALAEGGVGLVEFTLTGENALEAIEQARALGDVVVGAGSVLDAGSARLAIEAGAQFLVCPALVPEVASAGAAVPVILAGQTPSELLAAYRLTGGPVKLFPASLGGPAYVRAVAAPMPHVPLMPSGGVDASNIAAYLEAGAVAVNVGGPLCPPDAVAAGDARELARRATALRAVIDEVPRG